MNEIKNGSINKIMIMYGLPEEARTDLDELFTTAQKEVFNDLSHMMAVDIGESTRRFIEYYDKMIGEG